VSSTSDRRIVTLVDSSASVPKLSVSDKLLAIRNRRLEELSGTTGEFVNHAH
jgi:hypothetical protein